MTQIRKQVGDLTNEDFELYPAWEQASDEEGLPGQDEDTYRPVDYEGEVDGSAIVRTQFTLADGTVIMGYLNGEVNEKDRTVRGLHPALITSTGHIGFWCGLSSPESITEIYRKLKKNSAEIFPVHYLSLYPVINGPISGTINSFTGLDSKTRELWTQL